MAEMVQAQCPGCKRQLRLSTDWLQQPVRCKHCNMIFRARTATLPAGVVLPDLALAPPVAAATVAPLLDIGLHHRPWPARRRPFELFIALAIVIIVTALYVVLSQGGIPKSSSPAGLTFGVIGFLLMLSTETLYSLRKRLSKFHLGRMSTWLKVHIVTGIVGPYLVLLHSAGKFNGLAGVLALLTIVLVASGFMGRYIYTAVPRSADGAEVAIRELEEQIAAADQQLRMLGIALPAQETTALATVPSQLGWLAVLGRGWLRRRQIQRWRLALPGRKDTDLAQAAWLERLLVARCRVQFQIRSLAMARRMLALWHVIHVPLGVALFTLAFIHIGAALYFSWLLQ
jgi:hypothetical protein